ncbi:D-alanyl-D-alanine carboxypeptidase [Alphaproteobacteria bacterium HT1-32]|nr:D-alanyl-D-alanine carboxypeptidase [Alphaproteobacteria bacterium HT1-32]
MFQTVGRFAGLCSLAGFLAVASPSFALDTAAKQAVMIDAETGAVLFEKNADELMPPSSMSKMMTVYMLFSKIREGSVSLDDNFPVSEKAWRKGGSKMFVEVDTRVKVSDLIRGIIIQSGNDASIVVAEALAGSEEAFARTATAKAREMGMSNTTLRNATGWPDPEHMTTARDLATLSLRTIKDFPELYKIYAERSFTYAGIRQGNRNPLLYRNMGADGLKTGHTEAAGYGLASTVERNGRRLVLVVNGLDSVKARGSESERLLEWGFREFANVSLFRSGDVVESAEVWLGDKKRVPLVIDEALTVTVPRNARKDMKVAVVYDGPVPAPIVAGDRVADLVISAPGLEDRVIPLKAAETVNRLGFVGRILSAVKYIVWGA